MASKSTDRESFATDVTPGAQPLVKLADIAEMTRWFGYVSANIMLANSIDIATADGKRWHVTSNRDSKWSAWNEIDLEIFGPYASDEAALFKVREQSPCPESNTGSEERFDVVDEASRESFPASDPPAW